MRRTLNSWLLQAGLITKSRRAKRKSRTPSVQELEVRAMLHCEVAADNVTVMEADTPTSAVVTVTIEPPQAETTLVSYSTLAISAHAGTDFEHVEGTLTFAPGVTAREVTVPIAGDAINEGDEMLHLNLQCPTAHDAHAHLIIQDSDPLPAVALGDAPSVSEGQSATTFAVFDVALSAPSGRAVTVSYSTASGTAASGEDFQAARGAVVFQPGETLKQVTVSVNGDVRQEPAETFLLEITSADYALIDDGQAVGTILAEDFQFLVTGAGPGGGPHVRVFDPLTGEERFGFFAYDASFTGGVRMATADVNCDGVPDIITAAGPGGGPHVRVFDGKTGEQLDGAIGSFFAYDVELHRRRVRGGRRSQRRRLCRHRHRGRCRRRSARAGLQRPGRQRAGQLLSLTSRASPAACAWPWPMSMATCWPTSSPAPAPAAARTCGVFDAAGSEIDHAAGQLLRLRIELQRRRVRGGRRRERRRPGGPDHRRGAGGGPHVRVFDGRTGRQMAGAIGSFLAYEERSPAACAWRPATSTAMKGWTSSQRPAPAAARTCGHSAPATARSWPPTSATAEPSAAACTSAGTDRSRRRRAASSIRWRCSTPPTACCCTKK